MIGMCVVSQWALRSESAPSSVSLCILLCVGAQLASHAVAQTCIATLHVTITSIIQKFLSVMKSTPVLSSEVSLGGKEKEKEDARTFMLRVIRDVG
ncbi:hypothetical protein FHG87_015743 [Trinorchestia longiramus]|nr:hypothetical protein FHG87_015743 [Trinorchestia longiramus]